MVAWKLSQLFRDVWAEGQRRVQLWMPPGTRLSKDSPWQDSLELGLVQPEFHPMPALLLLSDAADWALARRVYGASQVPALHLLWGTDLRCWGHGALQQPAIRVALGPAVAEAWQGDPRLLEPVHTLPIGLDPETLLLSRSPGQPRSQQVLVLAGENPGLGLAVQDALRARELQSCVELSPWPWQRWLHALSDAAVVVLVSPALEQPQLALRHLAAMALQTPLVCDPFSGKDHLCREGTNALIRPADAEALAEAAASVLTNASLRRTLVDGTRDTCALSTGAGTVAFGPVARRSPAALATGQGLSPWDVCDRAGMSDPLSPHWQRTSAAIARAERLLTHAVEAVEQERRQRRHDRDALAFELEQLLLPLDSLAAGLVAVIEGMARDRQDNRLQRWQGQLQQLLDPLDSALQQCRDELTCLDQPLQVAPGTPGPGTDGSLTTPKQQQGQQQQRTQQQSQQLAQLLALRQQQVLELQAECRELQRQLFAQEALLHGGPQGLSASLGDGEIPQPSTPSIFN